jgi:DeoR family fructose operon transcriptional repressor
MDVTQRDLAPRRLERFRILLRQFQIVSVREFCKHFKVSAATVRRDLKQLENLGEVRRVHGGAIRVGGLLDEPQFEDKTSISAREKYQIARAALKYIQPNDTIFLDGGSTVLELARLLKERSNLTVVTNSLRAAIELAEQGPRLILIGGEFRRLSQTIVGPLTRFTLEELHVDKAFLGTIGFTLEDGLTTTDPGEAYTKKLVLEHARNVILLADHTKVGKISFAHCGPLEKIQILITDNGVEKIFAHKLRKLGIRVVKAS